MDGADPQPPSRNMTDADRDALREDGVICLRQILEQEWLDVAASGIDTLLAAPSGLGEMLSMPDQGFAGDLFMWMKNPSFRSLVFDSPLPCLAHQSLQSATVTHWYDQLFVKEPGSDVPTPWHHDLTFWPIAGEQIISLWIPLDDVDRASSGLEFIKGSHRWPNRYKAITNDRNEFMINPDLEDAPEVDADRSAYDLVDWDMTPGDVLVFNPLILHGSAGNASTTTRRRALASRWVGDDVVFAPQPHTMPLPRGHGLADGDRLGGPHFPTVIN